MKLTIDVTQEDIDLGCRIDTTGVKGGCMVWRAFNRCTEGSFPYFQVEYGDIHIFDNLEVLQEGYLSRVDIELPEDLEDKIRSFDQGNPVQPFSFEIELPESIIPAR